MMSKKMKLIPELRFPEFVIQGEWEYLNGNEMFEPISNKNHNSDLPILAITQDQGAIPRDMINYHVSVSLESVENYKVVEVGDFIISLRSFQGGIEYSYFQGLCSPAYIILRKKIDVINDFYRHYFKSFLFIQDLNKNLEGIRDGKMVSYKQFSDILIPNPKKPEQQKIASCLSSLDELIAAHSDKLEALKDHKKGLMQNLFPQKGQKLPNYRFPEFEKDGEWEFELLGSKTIKVGSGITPSGGEKNYKSKGRPFVRSQNVGWGCLILDDIVYIDEETHSTFSNTEIEKDDVLLNITGASIGRSVVASEKIKGGNVNQHVCIIRTTNELNPFFLNQFRNYSA